MAETDAPDLEDDAPAYDERKRFRSSASVFSGVAIAVFPVLVILLFGRLSLPYALGREALPKPAHLAFVVPALVVAGALLAYSVVTLAAAFRAATVTLQAEDSGLRVESLGGDVSYVPWPEIVAARTDLLGRELLLLGPDGQVRRRVDLDRDQISAVLTGIAQYACWRDSAVLPEGVSADATGITGKRRNQGAPWSRVNFCTVVVTPVLKSLTFKLEVGLDTEAGSGNIMMKFSAPAGAVLPLVGQLNRMIDNHSGISRQKRFERTLGTPGEDDA